MNKKKWMQLMATMMLAIGVVAPVSEVVVPSSNHSVVFAAEKKDDKGKGEYEEKKDDKGKGEDEEPSEEEADAGSEGGDDLADASLGAKASELANLFNQALSALGSPVIEDGEGGDDASESDQMKALKALDFTMGSNFDDGGGNKGAWPGNAGGALGYAGNPTGKLDLGNIVKNWINSKVSSNTTTYSYKSLENISLNAEGSKGSKTTSSFAAYAMYGKAINDLGYMKMFDNGPVGSLMTFVRVAGGAIIMVMYILALIIPLLFSVIVNLMDAFNPFKLLAAGLSGSIEYGGDLLKDAIGVNPITDGPLAEISQQLGGAYEAMRGLGVAVIVILIGWTVFSIFAYSRTSRIKNRIFKVFLRLMIMILAVPIIGGSYTRAVEIMKNESTGDLVAKHINYVTASSFIRVSDWVENTRLAPPSRDGGVAGDGPSSLISYDNQKDVINASSKDLRKTALAINSMSDTSSNWMRSLFSQIYNTSDNSGALTQDFDASVLTSGAAQVSDSDNSLFGKSFDLTGLVDTDIIKWNLSTIIQFTGSSRYNAAMYDSFVKGTLTDPKDIGAARTLLSLTISDLKDGSALFSQSPKFKDGEEDADPSDNEFEAVVNPGALGYDSNFYNNGKLVTDSKGSGFFGDSDVRFYLINGSGNVQTGDQSSAHIAQESNYAMGLSDLAMYNFLNTEFKDSGMNVYSAENSSSMLSLGQYQSVIMPGRGVDVFLLWLETVVVLGVFIILGLFFWWEAARVVFLQFFRILINAFGTALGGLNTAAKLLLFTLLGLVQINVILFSYTLVINLVGSFVTLAGKVASGGVISLPIGTIGLTLGSEFTQTFTRLLVILLMIIIAWVIKWAYKKHVMDALEDLTQEWVRKIVGKLDQQQGGDGSELSSKLGAAHEAAKKKDSEGADDFKKRLAEEKEKDRATERAGGEGRSSIEQRKAALEATIATKKARLKDKALQRDAGDEPGYLSDYESNRKDDVDEHVSSMRDIRRNRNTMAANNERANALGEAANIRSRDEYADGFGDVDANGRPKVFNLSNDDRQTISDMSSQQQVADNFNKSSSAIEKASKTIQSEEKKVAKTNSDLKTTQASLEKFANSSEVQSHNQRLSDAEATLSQTESDVEKANQRVMTKEDALQNAVLSGNQSEILKAQKGLDAAKNSQRTALAANATALTNRNAAQALVEADNSHMDGMKGRIESLTSERDNSIATISEAQSTLDGSAHDQNLARIAGKNLVENPAGTGMRTSVTTSGVFQGEMDHANSKLTQLAKGRSEASALQSRIAAAPNAQVAAQLSQDMVGYQQANQQLTQELVNMGFDANALGSDHTDSAKVNAVATQFNDDFNAFAMGRVSAPTMSEFNTAKQGGRVAQGVMSNMGSRTVSDNSGSGQTMNAVRQTILQRNGSAQDTINVTDQVSVVGGGESRNPNVVFNTSGATASNMSYGENSGSAYSAANIVNGASQMQSAGQKPTRKGTNSTISLNSSQTVSDGSGDNRVRNTVDVLNNRNVRVDHGNDVVETTVNQVDQTTISNKGVGDTQERVSFNRQSFVSGGVNQSPSSMQNGSASQYTVSNGSQVTPQVPRRNNKSGRRTSATTHSSQLLRGNDSAEFIQNTHDQLNTYDVNQQQSGSRIIDNVMNVKDGVNYSQNFTQGSINNSSFKPRQKNSGLKRKPRQ